MEDELFQFLLRPARCRYIDNRPVHHTFPGLSLTRNPPHFPAGAHDPELTAQGLSGIVRMHHRPVIRHRAAEFPAAQTVDVIHKVRPLHPVPTRVPFPESDLSDLDRKLQVMCTVHVRNLTPDRLNTWHLSFGSEMIFVKGKGLLSTPINIHIR